MKPTIFAIVFLIIGVGFAALSVHFSLLPGSTWASRFERSTINENAGYGSIAMAIIAIGCFISAALLIKKSSIK